MKGADYHEPYGPHPDPAKITREALDRLLEAPRTPAEADLKTVANYLRFSPAPEYSLLRSIADYLENSGPGKAGRPADPIGRAISDAEIFLGVSALLNRGEERENAFAKVARQLDQEQKVAGKAPRRNANPIEQVRDAYSRHLAKTK